MAENKTLAELEAERLKGQALQDSKAAEEKAAADKLQAEADEKAKVKQDKEDKKKASAKEAASEPTAEQKKKIANAQAFLAGNPHVEFIYVNEGFDFWLASVTADLVKISAAEVLDYE